MNDEGREMYRRSMQMRKKEKERRININEGRKE